MPKKTALEILEGAREILSSSRKWTRGKFTDDNGRYCLLGACNVASHGSADCFPGSVPMAVYDALADCVHERSGGRVNSVIDFNDSYKTKFKDIRAILDCAINKRLQRKRKKA